MRGGRCQLRVSRTDSVAGDHRDETGVAPAHAPSLDLAAAAAVDELLRAAVEQPLWARFAHYAHHARRAAAARWFTPNASSPLAVRAAVGTVVSYPAAAMRSARPEFDHEGCAERGWSGRLSGARAPRGCRPPSAAADHPDAVAQVDPRPAAPALLPAAPTRSRRWIHVRPPQRCAAERAAGSGSCPQRGFTLSRRQRPRARACCKGRLPRATQCPGVGRLDRAGQRAPGDGSSAQWRHWLDLGARRDRTRRGDRYRCRARVPSPGAEQPGLAPGNASAGAPADEYGSTQSGP
jgi:hypothetical protein